MKESIELLKTSSERSTPIHPFVIPTNAKVEIKTTNYYPFLYKDTVPQIMLFLLSILCFLFALFYWLRLQHMPKKFQDI